MFGRRRTSLDGNPTDPNPGARAARGPAPATGDGPGPFDVTEVTWPGRAGRERADLVDPAAVPRGPARPEILDLGALRVAVPPAVTARIVRGTPTGPGTDLLLSAPEFTVRVTVFAAPTGARLWAGVRAELTASHPEAEVRDGLHGPELLLAGTRMIGVDGPRWFLRAVVSPADARGAGELLHGLVVVRGPDAMPAGTPLPLVRVGPAGSRPTAGTLADLWTEEPLTVGTGTLEGPRTVHEFAGVFTGGLSRNLSTWG